MPHCDKTQAAGAALFLRYILDDRFAGDPCADQKWGGKDHLAASPHTAGQGHRWQEPAPAGMPVRAKLVSWHGGLGKAEMDQLRGRITGDN